VSNIMVVDDSMFMRKVLKSMLTKLGHTITCEAAEGREAVSRYKQFRPDVVTMDITMPGMDGLTALKEIIAFHPEAKIIICSAIHYQSLVIQGLRAGASDFIGKPIERVQLMEAINHATGTSFSSHSYSKENDYYADIIHSLTNKE
jgi:two-component system chemotaxis response regulator CheY